MASLELKNVCKEYPIPAEDRVVSALNDVSLSIAPGTFAALAGPSGSGKTTLLAILGALEVPTSGQVLFDSQPLSACSETQLARVRRRIGFVFQRAALIPRLAVWDNITYGLVPQGCSAKERFDRAESLLERFGLGSKIRCMPDQLSGGEQQRVAVARALVTEPEILLADEPTSNLDDAASEGLAAVFREIHNDGKTVLVASHDSRFVALAATVFELERGRLKGAL